MSSLEGLRTVAESLAWARAEIGAVDARVLLCHVTGWNAAALIARGDRPLSGPLAVRYEALVARRHQGEPVAYLIGEREFYDRLFRVTPAVLIPRPETELLVELALQQRGGFRQPRILDLGTGSGILAITLALEWPESNVCAVDYSRDALWVAMANAARLGASVSFIESDWFGALSADRFDLIVANPPYVALDDLHLQSGDVRFEPPGALASGQDGLDAISQIVAAAPPYLEEGGWILIEHGYDQAAAVRSRLVDAGFVGVESWQDLAGIERVSGGRRMHHEPLA